jgi:hypothetical protein
MDNPGNLLESVSDRKSFYAFVRSLIADWRDEVTKEKEHPSTLIGPGANGWENVTIGDFLDAALAWAEDSEWEEFEAVNASSWRAFAAFLYCGKIYE